MPYLVLILVFTG